MDPKEFLNLNIEYGDRIRVTIGEKTYDGFFGGFKTFEGTHSCLDYALYPVFYAVGKNGKMVQRSMVPGRTPYWGFSSISNIEKIIFRYSWKAYIDNVTQSIDAALRGPKIILEEWKKYRETGKSVYGFCDVDNESTFDNIRSGDNFTVLEDGKYAIYVFHNKDTAFVRVFERIDDR